MEKKKGTIFILIGVVLLIAAFIVTTYNIYDGKRAEKASALILPELQAEIIEQGEAWERMDNSSDSSVLINPDRDMPVVEIDGERYIGILEIPAINLTLPVMGDWSYSQLRIAPCRYDGSVYQNNMVIAGHNYARHFRPIKNLPSGTEIIFTDGEDRVFKYELGWVEVMDGTDVEDMLTGDWDLTLFTCTYGGEARYAARCIRK